jgi:hypothetical protein
MAQKTKADKKSGKKGFKIYGPLAFVEGKQQQRKLNRSVSN